MDVNFKFGIDQMVLTPLGQEGIVTNLLVDNTKGSQYLVTTSTGSTWWREDQVKAV